jgi:predicted TPR repeat methyltransferase
MVKVYDRAYFDRWYRDSRHRVKSPAELTRKVRMVVGVAEYHLGRPLADVIDIGCGEGAWRAPLLELRPRLRYTGYDASSYVVERYGNERNIRHARFAELRQQVEHAPADLVLCADVMHYLSTAELIAGLPALARLAMGVAYLDVFCRGDEFVGDHDGFVARSRDWYRKRFTALGLSAIGNNLYLGPALRETASALELA